MGTTKRIFFSLFFIRQGIVRVLNRIHCPTLASTGLFDFFFETSRMTRVWSYSSLRECLYNLLFLKKRLVEMKLHSIYQRSSNLVLSILCLMHMVRTCESCKYDWVNVMFSCFNRCLYSVGGRMKSHSLASSLNGMSFSVLNIVWVWSWNFVLF